MFSAFSSPFKAGRAKAPVVTVSSGGSMLLAGTASSYLTIANDADLRFGTGDFTIEWWQYQTDNNSAPRAFSIGTYSTASIAVSIEGGTFYYWNGSPRNMGTVSLKNAWHHIAVSRSGTSTRVFIDGTQKGSTLVDSTDYNNTTQTLRIGNESSASTGAGFGGNITNFHWVKGTAKYTSNFTPSTTPLTAVANSKLLLKATNSAGLLTDSSGLGKTVSNNNVTWDSKTPF